MNKKIGSLRLIFGEMDLCYLKKIECFFFVVENKNIENQKMVLFIT